MSISRLNAIAAVTNYRATAPALDFSKTPASEIFGANVFDDRVMQARLPKGVYQALRRTIDQGEKLDVSVADEVAVAMRDWAIEKGATHYAHVFYPLTGLTAEKHDGFLEPDGKGGALAEFSAKQLIRGEPDASSFPSGGLRCTFEARGYTAWDPTSPAFIKRHGNGATLCIPTVFCSYTGEVLDKKTPLLRSVQTLNRSVRRLMSCFKQPEARTVATLGPEQEYFLIDKRFYLQRPDLVQTGRTLFGAPPPKHQQLEDHFFGSIKPRVLSFMTEVEHELWALGIPAKTRHNEVAPAQFELAPIYEDQNLSIDHNMLVMEVLRQVADRNGLVCLLHEKPFAGVNGSGKHNNWAVSYGGKNLLDPGETPGENAIFLTLLTAIIRAVDKHSDLLSTTTAFAGNDHRLGSNEAPPAIISIFLGDQLTEILDRVGSGVVMGTKKPAKMRIGVDALPILPRDATDRNRTSPFAFTGNKFEFRAPGSSQSCAEVNMMLNTIVAESLDFFAARLEPLAGSEDFNSKLQEVLRDSLAKHRKIIFNGDNYSQEWVQEAKRRGLPNLSNTLSAIAPLKNQANQKLLESYGVLSRAELESRYEVFHEVYHRKIRIEGEIGLEIARSMIAPAVEGQYGQVVSALSTAKSCGVESGQAGLRRIAETLGGRLDQLVLASDKLESALDDGEPGGIIAALAGLRVVVDGLESLVDDSRWPLPKYREMLFVY